MNNKTLIKLSIFEAFFTSLVIGLAETYFPAFSLMKGASAIEAGVLSSAPLLMAALMQWYLLKRVKNLNVSNWVPSAVLIQVGALSLLSLGSLFESGGTFFILFFIYSIYWLGHFTSQPAWNRWMFDLISIDQSQYYFALRTRVIQVGIVLGLVLGGYLLHLNILHLEVKILFFGLFLMSCGLKYISYRLFKSHTPVPTKINFDFAHAKTLFKKYFSFFKSYSLFNFSLYLSAPFVVSYLLVARQLSYEQFMWVMAGIFFGKIVTTLILPYYKETIAPFKLLLLGGFVAAPLPGLWPFCTEVWMLFVLHFVSGLAWACWEVGLSLCFFKNLNIKEKMEMISIFNFVAIVTQIAGTLAGAALLKFVIHEDYDKLFIISGLIRLICIFPLRSKTFGETQALTEPEIQPVPNPSIR